MSMTNEETDTALILENELERRVGEVVRKLVRSIIKEEVHKIFVSSKDSMLMEVSLAVGKTLQTIENEGRKPLWVATPEEFGLTREDLNTHSIGNPNAIREQTPAL